MRTLIAQSSALMALMVPRLFIAGFGALVWGATVLHGAPTVHDAPAAEDAPAAQNPGDASTRYAPLGLEPMKYFAQSCERCHGPHGAFYGAEFGKNLSDEKLRQFVHDMAEGPAGAPLKGEALEAQVAYHRSLVQKTPFVVVTKLSNETLRGEATPNARISVCWQNGATRNEVQATRDGDNWSAKLPSNIDMKTVQISAQMGEVKTVIKLADEYSHRAPTEDNPKSEEKS
jgi:mono/diheme cytochrome c family protein